jgi:methionine salvage enolase-phosphatase E1
LALASASCSATDLLFLSDAVAELEAAAPAGFLEVQVWRESAVANPFEPSIVAFDELPIRGLHVL